MFDFACVCVALWLTCDCCRIDWHELIKSSCRGIMILLSDWKAWNNIGVDDISKKVFERNHYLLSLNSLSLWDTLGMDNLCQIWGKKRFYHHASNHGGRPTPDKCCQSLTVEGRLLLTCLIPKNKTVYESLKGLLRWFAFSNTQKIDFIFLQGLIVGLAATLYSGNWEMKIGHQLDVTGPSWHTLNRKQTIFFDWEVTTTVCPRVLSQNQSELRCSNAYYP